ncbi:DUF2085 domain-containing protein [Pseudoflavonifractor phocaeensis]|uniref:DUF2085 domain-containing protein n=1 Tax=Pseudoflavonifractor phocaeensis TaxID=1870988 RepID=UPI00195D29B7|nr:DUF2085 domain-containing protein [Pseudoflavonifractor phocaeensis]MBM6938203.1 DUF2085 domain-containing protein [Pseudoflavonifractor phocaeensis]
MILWLYRWLPILCGCHCRDDRSFHFHGRRFPVCARCTGELIGVLLAAVTFWLWHPSGWIAAALLLPLIVDGTVQARTRYESTNGKRLVTGILFGYGGIVLFFLSVSAAYSFGRALGPVFFGPRPAG